VGSGGADQRQQIRRELLGGLRLRLLDRGGQARRKGRIVHKGQELGRGSGLALDAKPSRNRVLIANLLVVQQKQELLVPGKTRVVESQQPSHHVRSQWTPSAQHVSGQPQREQAREGAPEQGVVRNVLVHGRAAQRDGDRDNVWLQLGARLGG